MRRKAVRRRAVRFGLLFGNIAILAGFLLFVAQNQTQSTSASSNLSAVTEAAPANPLDQLSSADIALTVAQLNNLPEAKAINSQAISQAAELNNEPTNNSVVSKPQIVTTALKSKADIQNYTAVPGDTITSIAGKFGVTTSSIRWSNNLAGESVTAGTKIVVPPVNGIVYTVKSGDTPDSLAARYSSNKDQIIAYNDAEITGIYPGEQIIIPNGSIAAAAPALVASFKALYGGNGYDYGYCTWYVATQISVPNNWGNANTWAYYAGMSGWTVSKVPVPGAIAQTSAGYFGHVAIVEAVSEDGTQIKYSDMNGRAGWGRVGHSDWTTVSRFQHYIYH